MLFYKIEARINEADAMHSPRNRSVFKAVADEFAKQSEIFYEKSGYRHRMVVVKVNENHSTFCFLTKDVVDIEEIFWQFEETLSIKITEIETEEITLKKAISLLQAASRNDFNLEMEDILRAFEIERIGGRSHNIEYTESVLDDLCDKDALLEFAEKNYFTETLRPEIERIYQGCTKCNMKGHPVHYVVSADDSGVQQSIYTSLLKALYRNGRIASRRYCCIEYDQESKHSIRDYEVLYRSCENGAIVVRYNVRNEYESKRLTGSGKEVLTDICNTAMKYKGKVLTILCLPMENKKVRNQFFSHLEKTPFLELYQDTICEERAKEYLINKAKSNKIRPDKKLLSLVSVAEKGYSVARLDYIFEEWYDRKLRASVYPQYKNVEMVKPMPAEEKTKDSAYTQLQELIGLSEAKKVVNRALNYYKVQKLFAEKGTMTDRPSMHMVFTGNPGTAKTTFARLFAQIMQEEGILSDGKFCEVGRGELVAEYVGQTAPRVKKAFERAKGGILFIDEAYSLVDDRDGLYGDEAISTIVQEMENHRDDTVVIFAGYPDEMEKFLNKNPGLRSRIAFHVPFEDYSAQELCDIATLIAREKGLSIAEDAMEKLSGIFEVAKRNSDFGNGRFVRNIIEQAKMAQASRLVAMDYDVVTDKDITTIREEDVEMLPACAKQVEAGRHIGFM